MFASIQKFKELYGARTDPSFWADNIIQASKLCKDDRETKHFYAYIINPKTYRYDHVESPDYKTIGDVTNDTDIQVESYPDFMETQIFKNGDEYTIYNKNTSQQLLTTVSEYNHDEKSPL